MITKINNIFLKQVISNNLQMTS